MCFRACGANSTGNMNAGGVGICPKQLLEISMHHLAAASPFCIHVQKECLAAAFRHELLLRGVFPTRCGNSCGQHKCKLHGSEQTLGMRRRRTMSLSLTSGSYPILTATFAFSTAIWTFSSSRPGTREALPPWGAPGAPGGGGPDSCKDSGSGY